MITCENLILCSLGGYAFARLSFPGREVLFMTRAGDADDADELRLIPCS